MQRRTAIGMLAAAVASPAAAARTITGIGRLDGDFAAIAPVERALAVIEAKKVLELEGDPTLEGAAFAQDGSLLFCDVSAGRIMQADLNAEMPQASPWHVFTDGRVPSGLFVEAEGTVAAACGVSGIVRVHAGGKTETLLDAGAGYNVNDLTGDGDGGFYFTHFAGESGNAAGGVFRLTANGQVIPVIKGMVLANGIALNRERNVLWATEFGANRLHRVMLAAPGKIDGIRRAVPYHFTGIAPDSMRCDAAGNVYVAMCSQGRVLVFNCLGVPVAQILLPGRSEGKYLRSTSLAIDPEAKRLFVVAHSGDGVTPSAVFEAHSLATGL